MALCVLLGTKDGLVAAVDPNAYEPGLDELDNMYPHFFALLSTRFIGNNCFSAVLGPVSQQRAVQSALEDVDWSALNGIREYAERIQEAIISVRRDTLDHYAKATGGHIGTSLIPQARAMLGEVTPEGPQILHISENGEIEEYTDLGYGILGYAELFGLIRLRQLPHKDADEPLAKLIAYTVLHDAHEFGAFDIGLPPHMWRLGPDGAAPLDEKEVEQLRLARDSMHASVADAIKRTAGEVWP